MEHEHYIKSLALMQATIDAGPDCNPAWDELYGYMHSVFPEPETAYAVIYEDPEWKSIYTDKERLQILMDHFETLDMVVMFRQTREEIIAKLGSIPPVILAVTFPVWVARYLLKFMNVPASPSLLTTFDEFHRRYGPMILASVDKNYKRS